MNIIKLTGKIVFEPQNMTKKHSKQSSWKRCAMVMFNDDTSEYYAWFLFKRYNLTLNPPLRKAHVTFVNDKVCEMNGEWKTVKNKWNGKEIEVSICVDPRTDSDNEGSKGHWWLNVPEEYNAELKSIREELGLGDPYYSLHLSLGYANEKNMAHSKYIHSMIKNKFIR